MSFNNNNNTIPLIELSNAIFDERETPEMKDLSNRVVAALKSSGFLLIKSPFLPIELQQKALQATQEIFEREHEISGGDNEIMLDDDEEEETDGNKKRRRNSDEATLPLSQAEFSEGSIVQHPVDPKAYLMLDCHSRESLEEDLPPTCTESNIRILGEYAEALETVKVQLLECIAVGLKLPKKQYLVELHNTRNSMLRLLYYYKVDDGDSDESDDDKPSSQEEMEIEDLTGDDDAPSNQDTSNEPTIRCKAHSDYGSITLLLTDGTPGLQAFVNDEWIPVPHVPGVLTVNIGSLLSEWSQGKLLATLHRVVSSNPRDGRKQRTSLAFFADPDPDISTKLGETKEQDKGSKTKAMSVADYIQYRSGGSGSNREGVQFTSQEKGRLQGNSSKGNHSTNSKNRSHNNQKTKRKPEPKSVEPEPPEVVLAAWKAALEIFVHELLYTRKVYPHDSFCKSRFLGAQCHLCRDPGVVSYITDALEVIVPALISDGNSHELVVEIYDQVDQEPYEQYYISFADHVKKHNGTVLQFTSHRLEEVEQGLRDLICSVGRARRVATARWPDSVSFQLLLQGIDGITFSKTKTSELRKAMEEGKWYRASRNDGQRGAESKRRPLYDVPNTGCSLQFQLFQPIQRLSQDSLAEKDDSLSW